MPVVRIEFVVTATVPQGPNGAVDHTDQLEPPRELSLGVSERPRQDSNLRTRLRRPLLYPLSYEGRGNGTESLEAHR